jgi:hypothetical protein
MYFAAMPSSDVWICAAGESIPNASQNREPLRWPASEIKVELVGVHNQLWTDSMDMTRRRS